MPDIQSDLKLTAATAVCLTETHLPPESDASFCLTGFSMFHQTEGQGVSVATLLHLHSHKVSSLVTEHLEYAARSAFSFPGIFTLFGIQHSITVLPMAVRCE